MTTIGQFVEETTLKCRALALSGLGQDFHCNNEQDITIACNLIAQMRMVVHSVGNLPESDESKLILKLMEVSGALIADRVGDYKSCPKE